MIENLQGIHEIVNYKPSTRLRLYENDECEHYPMHWHIPLEVLCPLEDTYDAVCNKTKFHLRTGDILFICPGTIHDLPAQTQGVRMIFQADCSILYPIKEIEATLSLMAPARLITPELCPKIHPRLHELLLKMRDEYQSNNPLSEGAIYGMLMEMLVLLGRNHTWEQPRFEAKLGKRNEYSAKFLSVCEFISAHCTEALTLDDVAKEAGFSKYHFEHLFKQFTGISFYKYLTQKRIAYAELLLTDKELTITEVALHSGFSSVTAFIRMFKILKQCTPSQFRNLRDLPEEAP